MQSKHKKTKCEQQTKLLQITAFSVGITILNHLKIRYRIRHWDTLYNRIKPIE